VLAFLSSAYPGQNKNHLAGSLNYSVTVGNITTFLQAGRGGADRTAQQAAVRSFDTEEEAKRQRRHEEVSAAISAGQHRRYYSDASIRERLSECLKALWDSGWGNVMRVMWQQADMREKMREVMSSDEMRERLQQVWAADGRLDWLRAVTSAATRHAMADDDVRERVSSTTREAMAREDVRERVSSATREAMAREDVRERVSSATREAMARDDVQGRHRAAMASDELREYLRRTLLAVWATPEMQARIQQQRVAECLSYLQSEMLKPLQNCSICPVQTFDARVLTADPRSAAAYQQHLAAHPVFADGCPHFVCPGCWNAIQHGKAVPGTQELFRVPPPPAAITILSTMELHFVRKDHVFVGDWSPNVTWLSNRRNSCAVANHPGADRLRDVQYRQRGATGQRSARYGGGQGFPCGYHFRLRWGWITQVGASTHLTAQTRAVCMVFSDGLAEPLPTP